MSQARIDVKESDAVCLMKLKGNRPLWASAAR